MMVVVVVVVVFDVVGDDVVGLVFLNLLSFLIIFQSNSFINSRSAL